MLLPMFRSHDYVLVLLMGNTRVTEWTIIWDGNASKNSVAPKVACCFQMQGSNDHVAAPSGLEVRNFRHGRRL